ncbi:MAG: trigger factor [Maritimibacter sp.]|nr:trigger factor [Maritimibacter sp.]
MTDGPRLRDFRGVWRLSREIGDRYGGQALRFEGTARFSGGDDRLTLLESGQMLVPGQPPMRAERTYHWHADGDGIAVFFEDGRPFLRIVPGLQPAADHDCPPDLYAVRYDFRDWPDWSAEWKVYGPRKDYVMTSWYSPDD